jgi:hypothetical protein
VRSSRRSGIGQKTFTGPAAVSGGLLNPSGGARDRPRNKSVLAQSENELKHNFAGGNEFCLYPFKKNFGRDRRTLLRDAIPVARRSPRQKRLDFPTTDNGSSLRRSMFGVGCFPYLAVFCSPLVTSPFIG